MSDLLTPVNLLIVPFCMLVKFSRFFLSTADFSKSIFFRKNLSKIISEFPDQTRQNVGPDLGPNCLQRLSANLDCK